MVDFVLSLNTPFEKHPDEPMEFHPKSKNTRDFILNMLAEQNMAVMEEFLALKQHMKSSLENLSNDVKNSCERLENKIETGLNKINTQIAKSDSSEPCTTRSTTTSTAPPSSRPPPSRSSHSPPRRRRTTPYLQKPKFLFVGDLVGHDIEFNKFEKAGKCRIKTEKAYSAVVNKNTRFPEKNVTNVTAAALKNTHNDDEYALCTNNGHNRS